MRTLLNHEWLSPVGGSENVFEQLMAAFPKADALCLWNDAPHRFGRDVAETWLARTPFRRSKMISLPLMSSAWRHVDLSEYDRVISSSHAFGHHLAGRAAREGRQAFAYVHSPARYIWAPQHDRRGQRPGAAAGARALKRIDSHGTSSGVHYAANSTFVSERIRSSWGREAVVIHPPVDVERIQSVPSWRDHLGQQDSAIMDSLPNAFVLGASRFVEYKRLDVALDIGVHLGVPVVLCGSGPDEMALRERAAICDVPVYFTGHVSSELLYCLYQTATLFVFPAVEDFGIMPVEAMALGTPVLVNAVGGASESIALVGGGAAVDIDDQTGLFKTADTLTRSDMTGARSKVGAFGFAEFRKKVQAWVADPDFLERLP